MHPIEIVEDLVAFIPAFQRLTSKNRAEILRNSYIFRPFQGGIQVSVWLSYTTVVGKTFMCKPTSIGRSHAKKSNICQPS
jgi:hypothetical protein